MSVYLSWEINFPQNLFPGIIACRKGLALNLVLRMKLTYLRANEKRAFRHVFAVHSWHSLEKTAEAFAVTLQHDGLKVSIEIKEGI